MKDQTREAIEEARKMLYGPYVRPRFSEYAMLCEHAEAFVDLAAEVDRLTFSLHRYRQHPDFEYATTQTARKGSDDPRAGLDGEGWEPNDIVEHHDYDHGKVVSAHWRNWERFQFHEDNYWRRRKQA